MRVFTLVGATATAVVIAASGGAIHVADAADDDSTLVAEAALAGPIFAAAIPGTAVSAETTSPLPQGAPDASRLPAGDGLVVKLPSQIVDGSHAAAPNGNLATADTEWRISMAAALSASRLPNVSRFRLAGLSATEPLSRDFDGGTVRVPPLPDPWTALTHLGTMTADQLLAQARSNAKVIEQRLDQYLQTSRIDLVTLDATHFGLRTTFKVDSIRAVASALGDALVGGQTGLVGNQLALAEGVATVVCDADDCAASFSAARRQSGEMIAPPSLDNVPLEVSSQFPNLTGGPSVTSAAHGGPASSRYADATLVSRGHRIKLRGVPCPRGEDDASGCIAGPDPQTVPTVACPVGRRLELRLHAKAEALKVRWKREPVSAGASPVLAESTARPAKGDKVWTFTVPRRARRASTLELGVEFAGYSTTFQAKTDCR